MTIGFPKITLESELGQVEAHFHPDSIRIFLKHPTDLVLFELILTKEGYVYNSNIMSSFVNRENDKFYIVTTIEKLVNDWIKDHPIEKLKFDYTLLQIGISNSQEKIIKYKNHLQSMIQENKVLVESENKNIADSKTRLIEIEKEILEQERLSLQKENKVV